MRVIRIGVHFFSDVDSQLVHAEHAQALHGNVFDFPFREFHFVLPRFLSSV